MDDIELLKKLMQHDATRQYYSFQLMLIHGDLMLQFLGDDMKPAVIDGKPIGMMRLRSAISHLEELIAPTISDIEKGWARVEENAMKKSDLVLIDAKIYKNWCNLITRYFMHAK